MKFAIHDADADHIPEKKFPNYALMKLSSYHKSHGDKVEWWQPLCNYDQVYSSKIFDFTPENLFLPSGTIYGGTGYDIKTVLPPEVECCMPDYSIYPACDYALGFTTRGCPNHCRWCVVPKKEGNIHPYRDWKDLTRPDTNKLVLLDNNILAHPHGINQLESLIGSGYKIDLNQGMDVRLVTPEIADILAKLKWIRFIRFSCDQKSQIEPILRVAELLEKRGKKPYHLFIYLLVTKDVEDAAYRVEQLQRLKGISIYAQAERNECKGIVPNREQLEFAQRFVYGRGYLKERWEDYQKRMEESR